MKDLIESTRVLMNEGKAFYRIPQKVLKNKLWTIRNETEQIYDIAQQQDYPYDRVADLIKDLQSIQRQAKKFDTDKVKGVEDLPKEFQ